MRAFISYVNDDDVGTNFATWLYEALARPEIPVEPWIDYIDLPSVGTFDRRLPYAVNDCDLFLFVRARHTPDSDACMDELHYAWEFGKSIIRLVIEREVEYDPVVDRHFSVDFTGDREDALRRLVGRIETLNKPAGQFAQLQEKRRSLRNMLRRLDSATRTTAEKELAEIELRLKELQAQRQGPAGASRAVSTKQGSPRDGQGAATGQESAEVVRRIVGDEVPTVLIVGPEGIGKTRLVNGVLTKVRAEHRDAEVVVEYRQTHGPQSFTANDLADLLKGAVGEAELGASAPLLERLDIGVVRKIEILMDQFRGKRMVVALDSGEALLDEATGKLVNAELDDALEVLASRRQSVVKLLLVTREQPLVRNRRWLTRAFTLSLDKGLPLQDFKELLADLDDGDDFGLRHPEEAVVETLHEQTGGRPRAAELVHGILSSSSVAESEHSSLTTLAEVVAALDGYGPDEALDFLTARLIDGLTPDVRHILRVVAAFGVPIDAAAVQFMLPGEMGPQIDRSLRNLRKSHLVRRTHDDRYYVQPPDDHRVFEAAQPAVDDGDWDRRSLILRAASYFALWRQPEVRGPDDLAAEFTEIDLLLQAEDFEAAFRAVEGVDDHLANWGCRWMLRRQRERMRGLLRNDLAELANLHALGDIALQRDDLAASESFFRQAVSYLDEADPVDIRTNLLVSLGGVLLRRAEMTKAESCYQDAFDIAREDGAEGAEIVPLMGLADCCRHWGQFGTAVSHLNRALKLARVRVKSSPEQDNTRLLISILLKLGTRHAEQGEFDRANKLIEEGGFHATEIDSWITQCQYRDAAANLRVRQNQIRRARELASHALESALELGRIPLQRQIYHTLAMCSLLDGDLTEAAVHIAAADRGRLPGHDLLTLAVWGLIEFRQGKLTSAQDAFRRLRLEAVERGRRDQRDFGALDMEGFAHCGRHLRRVDPPPLQPAIDVFRRARRVTRASGITAQLVQLLNLLDGDRLAPAVAAAAGGAKSRR